MEKEHIREAISASIGWALTKDTELLYRSLAQDERFFIFHPDSKSTIRGFEAFKQHVESLFLNEAFKATGFEIKELDIHITDSGNVAWFSCLLDDHGEWNGKPASWVNVRWTGVLEKQKDNWRIVQMHFSKASDN
ncbi:MAG: nuclear transport factor 2 family protein [Anaerolineales bacterium]|nr:nuclear transport factor 2 family protein [Anaerolineales bacterium]